MEYNLVQNGLQMKFYQQDGAKQVLKPISPDKVLITTSTPLFYKNASIVTNN